MFWQLTAIAAVSISLILAYRNRRLWRSNRILERLAKRRGWLKRAEEFVKSEDDK